MFDLRGRTSKPLLGTLRRSIREFNQLQGTFHFNNDKIDASMDTLFSLNDEGIDVRVNKGCQVGGTMGADIRHSKGQPLRTGIPTSFNANFQEMEMYLPVVVFLFLYGLRQTESSNGKLISQAQLYKLHTSRWCSHFGIHLVYTFNKWMHCPHHTYVHPPDLTHKTNSRELRVAVFKVG